MSILNRQLIVKSTWLWSYHRLALKLSSYHHIVSDYWTMFAALSVQMKQSFKFLCRCFLLYFLRFSIDGEEWTQGFLWINQVVYLVLPGRRWSSIFCGVIWVMALPDPLALRGLASNMKVSLRGYSIKSCVQPLWCRFSIKSQREKAFDIFCWRKNRKNNKFLELGSSQTPI